MRLIHSISTQLQRDHVRELILLQDQVWPKAENIAKEMEGRIDEYINDPEEAWWGVEEAMY